MRGKECEVKREKGKIIQILVDGRELVKAGAGGTGPKNFAGPVARRRQQPRKTRGRNRSGETVGREPAAAPYNFIPLNETVVEAEENPENISFDIYDGRLTGYVEYQLETVTPLCIRDTGDNKDNPDFFSPGGRIKIPGSSLRGMVRTLVEIVSWGKFGFFDGKKKLYFRAVGDMSNIGDIYRNLMLDKNNYYLPKVEAGLLIKNQILPSKVLKIHKYIE